jgi:DNA-binding beta-propeller fold protein YncE
VVALLAAAPAQASVLLPTGRPADPAGRVTSLQAYPTGVAVSPDGATVLALAGAPIQGGAGTDLPDPLPSTAGVALVAVDAASGAIRQTLRLDGGFQDIVYAPDGTRAYVAGGGQGAVQELDVGAGGILTEGAKHDVGAFVSALALTPDRNSIWVGEPEANRVQLLDLASGAVKATVGAPSPNQLALSPGGSVLYATNWRGRAITRIDTATGEARSLPSGLHPTDVAVAADGRVVVADAEDATLATYLPGAEKPVLTDLAQVERRNDAPNALVLGRDGRAYVSLAADDAIAVLHTAGARWKLDGLIPTGWYPDALALSPDAKTLHLVTARGLGHSALNLGVDPDASALAVDGAYATAGTLETVAVPADLAALTARARATLAGPASPAQPRKNPILAGPDGPLRHVVYITRENKTYDAILGDLHPGTPDNALTLFGRDVTPNMHTLQTRFAESDNFSYPGFASVVGHMWEDAGTVSDVFERAVGSDTGAHFGHGNDSWREESNYPASGLLTEQAWRAGLTVRAYNEELAQQGRRLPARLQAPQTVYPDYDLHVPDVRREAGWQQEFDQFVAHRCTGALAKAYGERCSLPALEYVYLGGDHTTVVDEPGYPSIQAQVADNDLATARVIDAVSHSPYWKSTLVIVVEDDPQGTGDVRSAYRGFLAVASPYVKRGTISHSPYNLASAVGAIDHILGLPPLTDFALTSRPLDDLFTDQADPTPFTADESGVARYPWQPLPGASPAADPAHGVYSFAEPDLTDPAVATAAQWRAVKRTRPPEALGIQDSYLKEMSSRTR